MSDMTAAEIKMRALFLLLHAAVVVDAASAAAVAAAFPVVAEVSLYY